MVCADGDAITVLCVDNLRATRLADRFVTLPPGLVLPEFWSRHVAGTR
jgi:hypothetical protein